jgi:hypothetical protein
VTHGSTSTAWEAPFVGYKPMVPRVVLDLLWNTIVPHLAFLGVQLGV